ncbi:hypothetical protein J2X31_001626 [Flavobacterium arsenatis]|uniref:Uncharacterized protein n=1 Tax=Flavobacterium arsenatis TaxID=1484332 RepID=A0ABU1TNS7_9FLAO|nr:DUF6029 family protein [Flavobacterium arsenatis]MDR6967614.1 hypothetical protein [Flavobacterium arsenatis]
MNKIILGVCLFTASLGYSQEDTETSTKEKKDYGKVFGGFESNSQWYLNDKEMGTVHPEEPVRSNNYLFVNYNYKNWTAGVQVEAYEPNALLNYNPKLNETNVATYFINYKTNKLDVTAGYFYEQFGSGLLLRSWEDRPLGLNNAIRGGKINYRPSDYLSFTALYGQQRTGFDISQGKIYGFNSEIILDQLFNFETSGLSVGFTYVGRDEEIDKTRIEAPKFDALTNSFAGRVNFTHNSFYISSEYNYKSEDAILDVQNNISNDFVKNGSALLFNMGYSKQGLGIDASLRRIENMGFYSERIPEVYNPTDPSQQASTSINYNDKIMNYTPALTKQHHSNLANIYVYQAQNRVDFSDPSVMKAGEIGGQIDVFYNIKKGTALGGKYGTKIAVNASNWYNLKGDFSFSNPDAGILPDYETEFIGTGDKYFSDYNIEITKKVSDQWFTIFNYVNQYYNTKYLGGGSLVKTDIVNAEATYTFSNSRSIRFLGEHMWADADRKNWAGATLEYSFNSRFACYIWDIYNYGNDDKEKRHHYYNIGGSYRKGASRISINYGRQRGGLVCVGGVCRFVPESTGLSLSLNTSF